MKRDIAIGFICALLLSTGIALAQANSIIHCDNPGSHDSGDESEPHTQVHEGPHVSAHGEVGDSGTASYLGLFQVSCSPDIVLFNSTKPAKCIASASCHGGGSMRCETRSSSGRAQAGLREDENGIVFAYIQCGEETGSGSINLSASDECTP